MGKKLLGCWPGRGSGLECGFQAGEGGSGDEAWEWRDVHCGGGGGPGTFQTDPRHFQRHQVGTKYSVPPAEHFPTDQHVLLQASNSGENQAVFEDGNKEHGWCSRRSGVSYWSLPGTNILLVSRACQGLRGHQSQTFQVTAWNSIMEVAILSPAEALFLHPLHLTSWSLRRIFFPHSLKGLLV